MDVELAVLRTECIRQRATEFRIVGKRKADRAHVPISMTCGCAA
jgi:hypothetical protein